MAPRSDTQAALDWSTISSQAASFITTEYASLDRRGAPITWPVTPYRAADGTTLDVATGLTYPLKAERARRNPAVALSFSQPLGSGIAEPATFVVQGLATVRDADLRANAARYLTEISTHLPEAFDAIPPFLLPHMAWYWARIWIEVTPVRVLWWPGGDLDAPPQLWVPPGVPNAPPSDPTPAGRSSGSWSDRTPADWRVRLGDAVDRLGMPVLTTVTSDGWPLPLRVRDAEPTSTGFVVRPPAGVDIVDGPACLTFHTHGPAFESQENTTAIGHCRNVGDRIEFDVQRTLNDFGIPANPVRRAVHLMSAGHKLKGRLEIEARRRGQTVPRFDELGFTRPADTRMMRIVHNALRRDVARATSALTTWPYPNPTQRVAIAEHLQWMMEFLHRHHRVEDEGLYPLVRQRVPEAGRVLDVMDTDHQALASAIDRLTSSCRSYAQDPSARAEVAAALDDLATVMLPHLEREESEMMPIVAAAVSKAEWDAVEKDHAVTPLSRAELAFTAHWLFDGATNADRALIRSVVPRPVAWAVETFAARDYERRSWQCWCLPQHSRLRQSLSAAVSVDVAAPIDVVWSVVSDPLRVPEWSHECREVRYLDGATSAEAGHRFRGSNRSSRWGWSRDCTVFLHDEPNEFAYLTSGGFGDATAWHFRLEPTASGTRLTQAFQGVSMPRWLSALVTVLIPGHDDRTEALRGDLMRLAALAQNPLEAAVRSRSRPAGTSHCVDAARAPHPPSRS